MQTARLLKLGGGNYVIGMGVAPTGDQRRSAYPSGSEAGSAGQVRPVAGSGEYYVYTETQDPKWKPKYIM